MVDGAYFSAAPEGGSSSNAVVLLTDVFGLPLKNNKILADELAKRVGCDVWVPDLFAGAHPLVVAPCRVDVWIPGSPPVTVDELEPYLPDQPGQTLSWGAKFRLIFLILSRAVKFFGVRPSVVDSRVTEASVSAVYIYQLA